METCKIYYCYKATNDVNGKVYIGFAGDPEQRWREHKRDAEKGKGFIFHQAIRKHGWDHFHFEVICCGKDKRAMLEYIEPALIDQYQSRITQHGYNMHRKVIGAVGREIDKRKPTQKPISNERRKNLSEYAKRRKITDELRQKLSKALKGHPSLVGRPAHNLGQLMSENQKSKISVAKKGIYPPKNVCVKMAKSRSAFWRLIFPDGRTQQIRNLSDFCCEHNSWFRHLGNGTYQCKGFEAQKLSPTVKHAARPYQCRQPIPKKLTKTQILEIRKMTPYWGYKTTLAKTYNVSVQSIRYALTRSKQV